MNRTGDIIERHGAEVSKVASYLEGPEFEI
jgi:hypothetical protein